MAATALSLFAAASAVLPSVHLFFRPDRAELALGPDRSDQSELASSAGAGTIAGPAVPAGPLSPRARALLTYQLALWEGNPAGSGDEKGAAPQTPGRAAALARMRTTNAEWDFMGRTFLVLALANAALREPAEEARYLSVIDRIVDDTLALEREQGMLYFLMPYATGRPFVMQPSRSAFVDGEIALMIAARALVSPKPEAEAELEARLEALRDRMERSPVLSAESYPDECWTFCNTLALAAMRLDDAARGGRRGEELARRWLAVARERLIDPATGLLISSYTVDGRRMEGPEGSSIWVSTHALKLVDPAFARDQYERARRALGAGVLGFAWAREWPAGPNGAADVDSGPIMPIVEASAGASGLALIGASSFGDDRYLTGLLTTLDFAAFPVREGSGLRYAASNQVGDATLLYALTFGPLWERAMRGGGA
jgi:hypothetical protein